MNLPQVFFQTTRVRRHIIKAYWGVFLLGIPLWWATTSIERLSVPAGNAGGELEFVVKIGVPGDIVYGVKEAVEAERRVDSERWRGLDVVIEQAREGHYETRDGESTYRVELHSFTNADDDGSLWLSGRTLNVRTNDSQSSTLHGTIAVALSGLLAPPSTSRAHLIASYATTYRLAFSLLNEDASAGGSVLSWDVQAGIKRFLTPVLEQLRVLHNFTIESQVQYHAPLAFEPTSGDVLSEEELRVFVNSAEWTLASSVSEDPVLHFILFVPSATRGALKIRPTSQTDASGFTLPQWGCISILNPAPSTHTPLLSPADLTRAFYTFRTQLLSLLGVSPLPRGVLSHSEGLSIWQLDTLLRRRAMENARDSADGLKSIVKVINQIKNMPVRKSVVDDVAAARAALAQAQAHRTAPAEALRHSARAHVLSSSVFFNPGMLALLYFPPEHKYAVYVPLFAPVGVPLVAAAVREIVRWRKRRDAREKEE